MATEELLKLAKKAKLRDLEGAWMEAVTDVEADAEQMMAVPALLAERGHEDVAETLAWYLIDALTERAENEKALAVAERAGRALPESNLVRGLLADLYVQVRDDREDIEALVDLTLRAPTMPTDESLHALENALSLHPGAYVLDPRKGAVGRVHAFDSEQGGLIVDFGESEGSYGLAFVGRLEPIDPDDFRALAVFEKERLQKLAEDDPEELMQIVLGSLDRRMEARRLRIYLQPVVGSWSRWWSKAREALKRSSLIGVTEGKSPSVFLRSEPLSHGERLLRRFRRLTDPSEQWSMALHLLQEARQHGRPEPQELQEVVDLVVEATGQAGGTVAVCGDAVIHALGRACGELDCPEPDEARLRRVLRGPEELVAEVKDSEVLVCVLDYVRHRAADEWPQFYAAVLPVAQRDVAALAARRLAAGHERELQRACRDLMTRPDPSPGALSWLWREATGAQSNLPVQVEVVELAIRLLVEASTVVRSQQMDEDERKARVHELRSALFLRDGRPLADALARARPQKIATVKGLAEYHPALTDHQRQHLLSILQEVDPSLFVKHVPPWKEPVIYTTETGMEKRRQELEYIVHERIPEVIREIGQAAQFGDLSENAEYSAAVEERARLAERAGRMQEELAEARVITRELASADHVTVGSRVRVRNVESGEERSIAFLGPWDARPAEDILAYNAPLGEVFMGREVGDVVTYKGGSQERRWKILAIEPAV